VARKMTFYCKFHDKSKGEIIFKVANIQQNYKRIISLDFSECIYCGLYVGALSYEKNTWHRSAFIGCGISCRSRSCAHGFSKWTTDALL